MNRWVPVIVFLVATAACGQSSDDTGEPDEVTKSPIHVLPVLTVAPWGSCDRPTAGVLPALDQDQCFTVGEDLTLEDYAASYEADTSQEGSGTLTLTLGADDLAAFNRVASTCFQRSAECPTAQLAIVFDGKVLVAPTVQEPEFSGELAVYGRTEDLRPIVDEMRGR